MKFDITTLALMLMLCSFASALVLYFLYRQHSAIPGLKLWAAGATFQALGSLSLTVREFLPPFSAIISTNLSYFLSYALFYQGVRSFIGEKIEWRTPFLIIVLSTTPLLFLYDSNEHLSTRIILNAITIGSFSFMIAWTLLKQFNNQHHARTAVALSFLLTGFFNVHRIYHNIIAPHGDINYLHDISREYLIFVWGIIALFFISTGFIIMTSERLRNSLQQQLSIAHHANSVAESALKEQKNFLAMLSHEFRSPLAIMRANVDAALSVPITRETVIRENLHRVQGASTRLSALVEGCLNDEWIAHTVESSGESRTTLNLASILRELAQEYGVTLQCDATDSLEISADRYLIPILFSSLIDNGCKYASSPAQVKVRYSQRDDHAVVEIEDDGPGISAVEQNKIFDKYYRAKTDGKRPGTGLGLYFAQRITELHGGEIQVESDGGTLFRVSLPIQGESR